MVSINRAIEGAADFRGMMDKIIRAEAKMAAELRAECDNRDDSRSVQGNHLPLSQQRQPGENRAAHRARLKRERREAKRVKVAP